MRLLGTALMVKKDVGMGLLVKSLYAPSLYLVSVVFGTTSLYIHVFRVFNTCIYYKEICSSRTARWAHAQL